MAEIIHGSMIAFGVSLVLFVVLMVFHDFCLRPRHIAYGRIGRAVVYAGIAALGFAIGFGIVALVAMLWLALGAAS